MSEHHPPPPPSWQGGPGPEQAGPQQQWQSSPPPQWQGAPPGAYGMPEPPRKKSWFARHKLLTGLLGLVSLLFLASLFNGGDKAPTPAAPTAGPTTAPAPGKSGGDTPKDTPAAAAPSEPAKTDEPAADQAPTEESKAAKVGEKVKAGDFEYTVTKVTPGVMQIGSSSFGQTPQGEFVLVNLTVSNTGDKAEMFNDNDQKLIDTQGREHSSDTEAAIYIPKNDSFLEEINPGNTLKGTVVFDVPKGAKGKQLKLKGPGFWNADEVVVRLN